MSEEQEVTIKRFASIISSLDIEVIALDSENLKLRSALRTVRGYLLGPAKAGLFDEVIAEINEALLTSA